MLFFSKVSLKSFLQHMIDVFCFPDSKVKENVGKPGAIKKFKKIVTYVKEQLTVSIKFRYKKRLIIPYLWYS